MLEKITFGKINNTIWVPSSKLINIWMVTTNGLIATGVWLSWLL
jgi:hypothetical protein